MRLIAGMLLLGALVVACSEGDDPFNPEQRAAITVQNRSGRTIGSVFFRECNVVAWGNDRMPAPDSILHNANRSFTLDSGCWDARVQATTGQILDREDIDLDLNQDFPWMVTGL
jgi:hypothetical protein